MAALTLAAARAQALQYADDANGRRFSSAQVDRALQTSLDRVLIRYVRGGGDRFNTEVDLTTDAADGGVNIRQLRPLKVAAVALVVAPTIYKVPEKPGMRRGYQDLTARSIRLLYVREYEIPGDAGHPLVGVGGIAALTFTAFDDWVCAEAAAQLLVKDDSQRNSLDALRAMLSADVLGRGVIPGSGPMARREWCPVVDDLSWQFVESTGRLFMMRVAW